MIARLHGDLKVVANNPCHVFSEKPTWQELLVEDDTYPDGYRLVCHTWAKIDLHLIPEAPWQMIGMEEKMVTTTRGAASLTKAFFHVPTSNIYVNGASILANMVMNRIEGK
jgi:hypothetical protein